MEAAIGSISAQFLASGNRVTMVDLSEAMLERARSRVPEKHAAQVEYVRADIADLEAREPYDLVLCIGVLAHVDSLERTIEKVASLVRPGGHAVFQISDDDQLVIRLSRWVAAARNLVKKLPLDYRPMTLREVVSIAGRHQLFIVRQRRHLLLLPFMARLLGRELVPYDLFVSRRPSLARHGGDVVFVCTKGVA
jgi:SAM-dependent methyltransferase